LADEQVVLAALTGVGFGYIVHRMGASPLRLLVILFSLWTLQTGSQFLYRALAGADVSSEIVTVTTLRLTFTAAAIGALWLLNRRKVVTDG